ncbi:MAG: GHMP kinase, partial [Acidobacteriota bacterium]
RAPLRLSFFGGGSDFPEVFDAQPGAVLSTAVNFSVHVTAARPPAGIFESPIRLFHRRVESCATVEQIEHPLVRAALADRSVTQLEIHTAGDLPSGTGLGSSSSFSVALLGALDALDGRPRDPMELAYAAIELERRVEHGAVGCQDQVMAALGGLRRLEFRAVDDIEAHPVALSPSRLEALQSSLLLVHAGGRRAAPKLERRKLDRVEGNRATLRHMVEQVDRACRVLEGSGPLEPFGEMLDQAWAAKRRLAPGVSTPEIDALYGACRNAGALGGKLLGAGGGGFLLLFVPPERQDAVVSAAGRTVLHPRLAQPGARRLECT